jgi:hypothetical protein
MMRSTLPDSEYNIKDYILFKHPAAIADHLIYTCTHIHTLRHTHRTAFSAASQSLVESSLSQNFIEVQRH